MVNIMKDNYKTKLIEFSMNFISEEKLIKIVFVILEKLVKSSKNTLDDKILTILENTTKK